VTFVSERQPTSDSLGTGRPVGPDELQPVDPDRLSRYDVLLGSIPILLLVSWLVGQFSTVPVWAAMAAGSLLALPLVADGLAVNPPQ
jgi:hypothetical protein